MESALIISSTEKNVSFFSGLLNAASIKQIAFLPSCGEARRLLSELDFDLVVVNAPLRDESGEALSRDIASRGASQVILAVKNEFFYEISAACENDGVLTISKPVDKALFWSALTLAKSTHSKMKRLLAEKNGHLKQQIEDIRIINRAKWILISYMNMNEKEAHRFIEKQAMDMRTTKRAIAEGVLKTYEN
jgi:response regulator NasT